MSEHTVFPGVDARARSLAALDGAGDSPSPRWEFLSEQERNVYRSQAFRAGRFHDLDALCFHCAPDSVVGAHLAGLPAPDVDMGAPAARCPHTTEERT